MSGLIILNLSRLKIVLSKATKLTQKHVVAILLRRLGAFPLSTDDKCPRQQGREHTGEQCEGDANPCEIREGVPTWLPNH